MQENKDNAAVEAEANTTFEEGLQEALDSIDESIITYQNEEAAQPKPAKKAKGKAKAAKPAKPAEQIEPSKPKSEKPPNKERFLKSKAYKWKVDLIETLLEDDKYYTKAEVDALIEAYMSGEVQ